MTDEFDLSSERDTLVGTAMEQFEISQKIGEGSIGTIYKAYDLINQRDVAIKFLTREVSSSPQVLERFKREIQTTLKMSHPNIVKGYTAGVWEGCIYYYVMEHIDGSTLHDLMARERITEELAVEIYYQMAHALKYIYEFGMVHRDVKPENIMITREGVAKLTDLGLAKAKNDMSGVTLVGTIIGTPLYMSPEQAKGSSIIDIRADIYSLGGTVYHVVTGEPPFKGSSAPVVIAKQINEVPRPVRELNPSLTPGLEYVVRKSMEKDPGIRYQKPQDLMADLKLLQEGKGSYTDTNVPWGLVASEAKEKMFHFAYYPNEEDFEFTLTAVANKLVDPEKMGELLDLQEEMARHAVPIKLSYLSVEQEVLTEEQGEKIKLAQKRQRFKETGSEFGKLAVKARFVSEGQVKEALKIQEDIRSRGEADKLLGNVLRDLGYLDERQINLILSQQQSLKHAGEDRLFTKLSLKKDLVSQPLIEKASTIQQNEIAMGRYREIGDILVERKYISESARAVLMRAIRRKHLTAESIDDLIAEKEALVSEERTTATIHFDDNVLRKYQERVDALVEEGKRHYKKREFRRALDAWEQVFQIYAAHDETEKLLRKTRDIVENLDGHLVQAGNFFELALREWKAVMKIKGDYPGVVSGIDQARKTLSKLGGGRGEPETEEVDDEAETVLGEGTPRKAEAGTDEAPEAEDEADRLEARAQRYLKHARRFVKEGRTKQARQKLFDILQGNPEHAEAATMLRDIDRRARRTAVVCLLLIVVLLGGAAAGGIFLYGPVESLNLLFRLLGEIHRFLGPA
jgi:serine/threonine protein kinase